MERTNRENSPSDEFFTSEDIVVQQLERAGRAAIPPLDLDGVDADVVPRVDSLSRTNGASSATATAVQIDGAVRKAPPPAAGGRSDGRAGKASYTGADIQILEGIQAIRHRPGMYIGSTSTSGLCHLLWEALDNAVDEAVAGWGTQIWVEIDKDAIVRVLDEGRGMPFDVMTYQGKKLPVAT